MRTEADTAARWRRVAGAAVALALAAGLLAVARPITVWRLLEGTDPRLLAAAAAASAAAVACRGLRLVLLLPPGRLRFRTATVIAATAHAAATFVPARAGELALPLLLRRAAGWDASAGVSTLLAARTLDVAALGLGAGVAVVAVSGLSEPLALAAAALLLVPPLLLPYVLAVADRIAVRTLAPRGLRGRRWARRVRRVRRALDELRLRPRRVLGAAAVSLLMWAFLWGTVWLLLAAMEFRWPVPRVVAGSTVATLANMLPFTTVANIGTAEAGWTAGFVALGVPLDTAAATGYACHAWALVFAAVFGAIGWLMLVATRRPG